MYLNVRQTACIKITIQILLNHGGGRQWQNINSIYVGISVLVWAFFNVFNYSFPTDLFTDHY